MPAGRSDGCRVRRPWPASSGPRRRTTRRRRPVRGRRRDRRGRSRACGRSRRSAPAGRTAADLAGLSASACRSGSESWRSRSACSASSASIAGAVSVIVAPPRDRSGASHKRKPTPGLRSRADRASVGQLVVGSAFCAGLALAVALLEAGHAAAAVEDLLLAGVERVALRADLDVDLSALLGAARRERVAAAADAPWSRRSQGECPISWCPLHSLAAGSPRRTWSVDVNRNRGSAAPLCQVNRQYPKRADGGRLFRGQTGPPARQRHQDALDRCLDHFTRTDAEIRIGRGECHVGKLLVDVERETPSRESAARPPLARS